MSSKAGMPLIQIKYVVPSLASGISYTNVGAPITTLDTGKWLVQVSYALDPITVGASIQSVFYTLSRTALVGDPTAVGILMHSQSAATGGDINNKCSNAAICTISADNTPIYFAIGATTSTGNYQSSASTLDSQFCSINCVKLQ
jgi:hypothetical protein